MRGWSMSDVIDALMDDDTYMETEKIEKTEKSEKRKQKTEKARFRVAGQISDVELNVLRCLKETKNVRAVSRMTGYPEIVVSKAIERLIEKGYIDCELNVIREVPRRRAKPYSRGKLIVIDIAIAVAALILIIALAYYFMR